MTTATKLEQENNTPLNGPYLSAKTLGTVRPISDAAFMMGSYGSYCIRIGKYVGNGSYVSDAN